MKLVKLIKKPICKKVILISLISGGILTNHPSANAASFSIIDDFSSGTDFTESNTTVNYSGSGPIGGSRQVVITPTLGTNTTSLNTSTGNLSISTTGFADTNVNWGTFDTINGSELNLAVDQQASMEIVFDSFDDSGGNAGGIYLRFRDSANTFFQHFLSATDLQDLDQNNGGVLSVPILDFQPGSGYTGEIDGVNFSFDDRNLSASITEVRFASNSTPVPEPATILGTAIVLGLGALSKRESSKKKN